MKKLNLHIKDMICSRCETVIRQEMRELKAKVISIKPGYATVEVPTNVDISMIAERLGQHGFELLEDPEQQLVGQIKTAIREYLHCQEKAVTEKGRAENMELPTLSNFLAYNLGRSYSYLSKLFSRYEGHTLEYYCIHLRIERVKELLDYNELNVSEIADKLGYSSGHYLSAQFKKVTGMSISEYRKKAEELGRQYFDRL